MSNICSIIDLFPTLISGLGKNGSNSLILVPCPPQKITTGYIFNILIP
jgi:hypothetical protein